MVCKNISIDAGRPAARAFTLIELLVWMGVASLVLVALLATSAFAGRSFFALANYAELETKSRIALDQLSRDIRQMEYLTNFGTTFISSPHTASSIVTNSISLAPTPGAGSNAWIRYTFNPFTKTLTRSSNNTHRVILKGCDYLNFGLFQRNQVSGQFQPIPTVNPSEVKLIEVQWVCSRTMLAEVGVRTNSESVQSAKFVIRRQ
jgi:hypothetical protein